MDDAVLKRGQVGISLSQLNLKQKQAANHVHGPMLVLAGAGTGKTSVLVHRVSRLILAKHARANEIRAFTFTHKAANEIRTRVAKSSAGISAGGLNASTFHGYCYQLLRECGQDFELLDQYELWAFLRQNVGDLPLNRFLRAANPGRFLSDLIGFFDRCSDELVTAESYAAYIRRVVAGELLPPRVAKKKQAETMTADEVLERCREIASIYAAVERLLRERSLLTFGALVCRTVEVLRSDSQLLERERRSSRFLLVDEFQDSNHAQIELTRLLAGEEQNVFAVGDPDQAIYHFRGASSAAFSEFVSVFDRLESKSLINLAENQRSTQHILDCGYSAIRHNPKLTEQGSRMRFDRAKLVSAREQKDQQRPSTLLFGPEPVHVVPYAGYGHECSDIAERILRLHEQGARWSDCAVLFRGHSHAEGLVEELGARSIPFEVQDTDVFDTDALRDLLAWLHCANSSNNDVSYFRLALRDDSGVDLGELHAALSTAQRGSKVVGMLEQAAGGSGIIDRVRRFADQFPDSQTDLVAVINAAADQVDVSRVSIELTRFLEFARKWQASRLRARGTLSEFLDFLDLYREGGGTLPLSAPDRPEEEFTHSSPEHEERDAVKLLTIHAAKGLEFRNVFVLRVASPSFPTNYRETLFEFPRDLCPGEFGLQKADEQIHKEEERRLFYVAITRARDTLALYGKERKSKKGATVPTPFLRELTDDESLRSGLEVVSPCSAQGEPAAVELPGWIAMPANSRNGTLELSASAIDAYTNCPLKFALQKRWRLPEEPSAALQYGSAMHTALRDYYDAFLRGVERTPEETIGIFLAEFEQAKIDEDLQRKLYERQGTEQLRQFIALRALEPKPQVLCTEKNFRFTVEDVVIIGRIDRVDRLEGGGVLVLDYKTGAPRSSQNARESIQLGLYGLAAQLENHRVDRMAFYNLEDNSTAETDRIDKQKLYDKVRAAANGIRRGDFSPKTGFQCRSCGYRSLCPATVEKVFPAAEVKIAGVTM